jgi:uncharacterized delta-60 repeat protein
MRSKTKFGVLVVIVLFAGAWLPAGGQSGTCSGAGCPDSSFGTNGILRLPSFGGAIGAIAIQNIGAEERVVALNTSSGSWKLTRYRFTAGGGGVQVDTSFGSSGVVTKAVNGFVVTASQGVAVKADNKLVVVGSVKSTKRGAPSILTVVQYTPDGREDASFGQGGTVTLPGWNATAGGFRLQSDGKILLAVRPENSPLTDSWVMRLDQAGQLDWSFGDGGVATVLGGGMSDCLAVQEVIDGSGDPQDKIVLGTTIYRPTEAARYTATLVRLNTDGSRDWNFAGGRGAIETPLPGAEDTTFNDVTIDVVGRIVTAGHAVYRTPGNEVIYQALAARFDPQGNPDLGFATGGVFAPAWPGASIQNVAIGPDDNILLVGHQMPTFWNTRGLVLGRLLDDGVPDPFFGINGLTATIVTQDPMSSMWPGFSVGTHVAFVGNGQRVLVGGSAYTPQSKKVYAEVGALGRFLY